MFQKLPVGVLGKVFEKKSLIFGFSQKSENTDWLRL